MLGTLFSLKQTQATYHMCVFSKKKKQRMDALNCFGHAQPSAIGLFFIDPFVVFNFFFYLLFFFNYIIKSEIFIEFYLLLLC